MIKERRQGGMKSVTLIVSLIAVALFGVQPVFAGGDWNDAQIQWRPYKDGLEAAKTNKKPVCLVFYTDWCPHCTNYSGVFHDAKVVERAKQFIMIRLNKDQNAELSRKYAPDGEYIPRTYFLSPAGDLLESIHAPRDRFRYFYDERNPASLLAGMTAALDKTP